MPFQVTANQLAQIATRVQAASLPTLADALNETMQRFQVDQAPRRVRYFVAQAAFETAYFTKWVEDLTYTTPERLVAVWPSRFTMVKPVAGVPAAKAYAPLYVNNQQGLANLVYAGRDGNGNAASGDGWAFRGHGAFHLTFRNNYAAASKFLYGDANVLLSNPDSVAQYDRGCATAGWFWNDNGLNAHADKDEFTLTTSIINGAKGDQLTELVKQRLVTLNLANKIFQW